MINILMSLIIMGKASYYTEDGCLGCNSQRVMANGQILNDKVATIALTPSMYKVYRNQTIFVYNASNGKIAKCKVTDSGGFAKYNRIADLNKACAKAVELKTDKSKIMLFNNI
jgi:hypothetical protein